MLHKTTIICRLLFQHPSSSQSLHLRLSPTVWNMTTLSNSLFQHPFKTTTLEGEEHIQYQPRLETFIFDLSCLFSIYKYLLQIFKVNYILVLVVLWPLGTHFHWYASWDCDNIVLHLTSLTIAFRWRVPFCPVPILQIWASYLNLHYVFRGNILIL